ncbi:MAG: EAL domain-containing protein, partial [Actinobacteria bacterium]
SYRSQPLHVPYIAVLGLASAVAAWGAWRRFQLDRSSQSFLLAAAFAGLGLLYLPHAFYNPHVANDPVHFFFGPASRLAFGLFLIAAMVDVPVPRMLERPGLVLTILAVSFAGIIDVTAHSEWVRHFLGPEPYERNELFEKLALAAQTLAFLLVGLRWLRTRRPFLATLVAASVAMWIGDFLMVTADGWQGRWWLGHLGLLEAAAILLLGSSNRLVRAIDRDELVLHYQPKIELQTGRLVGVEALVRWQHPERGLMAPALFMSAVESTGMIRPFTRWSIQEALRQHMSWRDDGLDIPVAVNLSARLLDDHAVVAMVREELDALGLAPGVLELELTETAVVADVDHSLAVLDALAAMGVRLAVDDYGTGYSSLGYLKRLPVVEIKIDKGFVSELTADDNDFVIVRSTIGLAHGLGKIVVAEGVEREETARVLTGLGCDVAQGYYYARPLPPRELLAWARRWEDQRVVEVVPR